MWLEPEVGVSDPLAGPLVALSGRSGRMASLIEVAREDSWRTAHGAFPPSGMLLQIITPSRFDCLERMWHGSTI